MWVCRTQYIWDPSDSKLLFAELSCDMSVMEGGAPANVAGGASIHADETAQKPLAHLGIKQASRPRDCPALRLPRPLMADMGVKAGHTCNTSVIEALPSVNLHVHMCMYSKMYN